MTPEGLPLLVLGLGNILCGDDGAGVVAVRELEAHYDLPPGVRVMDGGTLGLGLVPYLCDARAAILVDAVDGRGTPGTLVRFEGAEVAHAVSQRVSVHQVGVADLLAAARWLGDYPARLVLLGLVPGRIALTTSLSPAVAAAIPRLVDAIVEEARRLGHLVQRRSCDVSGGGHPGGDAAVVLPSRP